MHPIKRQTSEFLFCGQLHSVFTRNPGNLTNIDTKDDGPWKVYLVSNNGIILGYLC